MITVESKSKFDQLNPGDLFELKKNNWKFYIDNSRNYGFYSPEYNQTFDEKFMSADGRIKKKLIKHNLFSIFMFVKKHNIGVPPKMFIFPEWYSILSPMMYHDSQNYSYTQLERKILYNIDVAKEKHGFIPGVLFMVDSTNRFMWIPEYEFETYFEEAKL